MKNEARRKGSWRRTVTGLLCIAMMAATVIPASAASAPSVSRKTDDGVNYTLQYPKVYGYITAKIEVAGVWEETATLQELKLPVVASGDPFILRFDNGMTCKMCADCDKPLNTAPPTPDFSIANGTTYDGPCMLPIMLWGNLDIGEKDSTYTDAFAYNGTTLHSKLGTNQILFDGQTDSVGLRELESLMIDPDKHFSYAPGNTSYVSGGDNSYAGFSIPLNLGYYLRLPKATIDKMDFSKTYNTKELEALIKGTAVKRELTLLIEDSPDGASDSRQAYTITNNTETHINGSYALLSYWPKTIWYPAVTEAKEGWYGTSPEYEHFRGQVMSFDLNLAPGESVQGKCYSTAGGWSTMNHIWIAFDDAADRDAFFKSPALGAKQFGYFYEIDMGNTGIQWMKDTFNIAIRSGKPIN